MASTELEAIPGFHKVKTAEARELLQPHMRKDGHYLLRPSSDSKGGVLCTICVTNRSKLVNYRLVKDKGSYYIHSNACFRNIPLLLAHYKNTPINPDVNTLLLHPVLTEKARPLDDMYVVMERALEESSPEDTHPGSIPGLHLYLPKSEINTVMSNYLDVDGHYLVRPSASAEGQLTLAVSNCRQVLNFKINANEENEFYISPRRKFPTAQALLHAYRTTPIRSKKVGSAKILLLYPIPVDPIMEQRHKNMLEEKAARKAVSPTHVPAQEPLPAPWQQHMNQQYKKNYYYNTQTMESTWERPKALSPLALPPRANGHISPGSGPPKMRDRPLPGIPGKTTPTRGVPPLPSKTELPVQNGTGPGPEVVPSNKLNLPRDRMALPPLPSKENTTPSNTQEFPRLPP